MFTKPKSINFILTEKCNSSCVMCNVWSQSSSITPKLSEFEGIVSNPVIARRRICRFKWRGANFIG